MVFAAGRVNTRLAWLWECIRRRRTRGCLNPSRLSSGRRRFSCPGISRHPFAGNEVIWALGYGRVSSSRTFLSPGNVISSLSSLSATFEAVILTAR